LQGFPDKWGHPDRKEDFTDEEYRFWCDVVLTKALIDGTVIYNDDGELYFAKQDKPYKPKTKEQLLNWYNKLHTDSAEYKMWGNGIALPCALYVMQGIEDALKEESKWTSTVGHTQNYTALGSE
jgi:DNA (cytosine-5)-methyltransferase 1